MTQFVAFDPRVEVNGRTIMSVLEAIPDYKEFARGVLDKNGIHGMRRGSWHSQQSWLNAFRDIAREIGGFTLYAIGRSIPDSADWPARIETLDEALASIDVAYHMNHRIGTEPLYDEATGRMAEGIGHYTARTIGPGHVQLICDTPYPCDFDKGVIAATANKFKSPRDAVSIREGPECRKAGAASCTYTVRW
jgi:hypothetical protein